MITLTLIKLASHCYGYLDEAFAFIAWMKDTVLKDGTLLKFTDGTRIAEN